MLTNQIKKHLAVLALTVCLWTSAFGQPPKNTSTPKKQYGVVTFTPRTGFTLNYTDTINRVALNEWQLPKAMTWINKNGYRLWQVIPSTNGAPHTSGGEIDTYYIVIVER